MRKRAAIVGLCIVPAAVIAFCTASLINYYHQPRVQWIGTLQEEPTPVPNNEDIDYWTEPVPNGGGVCKCPGGFLCTTCPYSNGCRCSPTRLDFYDARRRYEQVRAMFGNTITLDSPDL